MRKSTRKSVPKRARRANQTDYGDDWVSAEIDSAIEGQYSEHRDFEPEDARNAVSYTKRLIAAEKAYTERANEVFNEWAETHGHVNQKTGEMQPIDVERFNWSASDIAWYTWAAQVGHGVGFWEYLEDDEWKSLKKAIEGDKKLRQLHARLESEMFDVAMTAVDEVRGGEQIEEREDNSTKKGRVRKRSRKKNRRGIKEHVACGTELSDRKCRQLQHVYKSARKRGFSKTRAAQQARGAVAKSRSGNPKAKRGSKANKVAKIFRDALKKRHVQHGPMEAEDLGWNAGWDERVILKFNARVEGEDVPVTVWIGEATSKPPREVSGDVALPSRWGGVIVKSRRGGGEVEQAAREMASELANHLAREPRASNPRGKDAFSTQKELKRRKLKPIAVIGDMSPVEHQGGVVYEGPGGEYELHYFQPYEGEGEDLVSVSIIDIREDVLDDLNWVDWKRVADYIDMDVDELKGYATSSDPVARASVYEAVGSYNGFSNLGSQDEERLDVIDRRYDKDINKAHQAFSRRSPNPKRCPPGQISIDRKATKRKGYKRKDGTKVKPSKTKRSTFCVKDRGRKGKTSFGAEGGPRARMKPLITRRGKLGGAGYTRKPDSTRHGLLDKCVKKYGYRSCMGTLQALTRSTEIGTSVRLVIEEDIRWLQKKYGGEGSFGPRKGRKKGRRGNPKGRMHEWYVPVHLEYDDDTEKNLRYRVKAVSEEEAQKKAKERARTETVNAWHIRRATAGEPEAVSESNPREGTEAAVYECVCALGFVQEDDVSAMARRLATGEA